MSKLQILELRRPKFGQLMRRIRKNHGLSLRQLAAQVELDHSYLYQIEREKQLPPVGTTSMAIARALDSVELMELAEWALLKQLLLTELQRHAVYMDLSPKIRKELGISDDELKQIDEQAMTLFPRLHAAKERREVMNYKYTPLTPKEEKAFWRETHGLAKQSEAQGTPKKHAARKNK
jgi:transcriptional regulator with XRE-family HTH domain